MSKFFGLRKIFACVQYSREKKNFVYKHSTVCSTVWEYRVYVCSRVNKITVQHTRHAVIWPWCGILCYVQYMRIRVHILWKLVFFLSLNEQCLSIFFFLSHQIIIYSNDQRMLILVWFLNMFGCVLCSRRRKETLCCFFAWLQEVWLCP
jgi:hypothetical protein